MQETTEIILNTTPLFTNATIVFGLLMLALGLFFIQNLKPRGFGINSIKLYQDYF